MRQMQKEDTPMTQPPPDVKALKDCRWCDEQGGDKPSVYQMDEGPWQVVCGSCLACGPCGSTEDEAIKNWNEGPLTAALPDAGEDGKCKTCGRLIEGLTPVYMSEGGFCKCANKAPPQAQTVAVHEAMRILWDAGYKIHGEFGWVVDRRPESARLSSDGGG